MKTLHPKVLEDIQAITGISDVNLRGSSANPYWHVPRALHSALGEIEAAKHLISLWEPYRDHRLREGSEDTLELGLATCAVINTALIVEKALKTLLALQVSGSRPRRWHSLNDLFDELEPNTKQDICVAFREVVRRNEGYWEDDDFDSVLTTASATFVKWRYGAEPNGATGGIAKGVLLAGLAIVCVGVTRLTQWRSKQT